ncbi:ATP-binding cassette domain-containing protein [Salidesulfovibrio onnuriiensis]|uniref:ATP-binding cassette domain-containing protein n=1 Tax=Salidesulfovibrio onnuriiensis TaxID=2583823 RepID=UPI0011C90487|nr:ATP-binding cassette domain-containing protein [Salidesulfovibrio onnuriiensis]
MALISLQDISINFTGTVLLDRINLQVEQGERICLVGRNGEGKSTLLSVINGDIKADSGEVAVSQGVRIAMLPQSVPTDLSGSTYDVAASGLGRIGKHLADYHRASRALAEATGDTEALVRQLEQAQHVLDADGAWERHQTIEMVLSHLKLDADEDFATLSGGTQRRVLLARALACQPDLLVLDEPTNHLDIDSIVWLEEFLLRQNRTLLFVTHDRAFLRKLATRIVEIDRGRLTSWECDYETYMQRKEEALAAEAKQNHNFDKKLAQEEQWIRQGIKARRTRNMGRVRELRAMREERGQRRERTGKASMVIQEADRTGKMVTEATDISFGYGGKTIIGKFSCRIMRGDKIGLVGPNGAGKTTLLKLLLKELEPATGSVRHGVNLEVSYFDQHREVLKEDQSARDNIAEGADYISINGGRKHVLGYLKEFLFTPDRAQLPVSVLSGGERNRLLLAKLFTRPSNVLVMDEPTNDLDVETLDLLEELLLDYSGTLLLVSHDRAFLNNVATSTIAFEGEGVVREYVGGYDDWLRQRPERKVEKAKPARREEKPKVKPGKLSYKEKYQLEQYRKELEELPARIEALETGIQEKHDALADPELYRTGGDKVSILQASLEALESELETVFARWEFIEQALEDAPAE